VLQYNIDMRKATTTILINTFVLYLTSINISSAKNINKVVVKKSKYYVCDSVSNYSGSPGVDKNPQDFYDKNCKTSPSLIGSSICLKNNHCKLDKLFLEKYLDSECKKKIKTKHKQYFIKNFRKNTENIEIFFECKKSL